MMEYLRGTLFGRSVACAFHLYSARVESKHFIITYNLLTPMYRVDVHLRLSFIDTLNTPGSWNIAANTQNRRRAHLNAMHCFGTF
jgi:hypothetical protein